MLGLKRLLANAAGGIGKRFTTVIVLYLASTLIAAMIAVVSSFLFPLEIKLTTGDVATAPHGGLVEIFKSILGSIVQNPIAAIGSGNYVGILAWAVMLGLAFKAFASQHLKESLQNISDAVSQVVRWIIGLAPVGILGLVYTAVSTSGLSIFADYGKLLLLLVGTMAFVTLVSNPLIVALTLRRNPYSPTEARFRGDEGRIYTRPVHTVQREGRGIAPSLYLILGKLLKNGWKASRIQASRG